jgi:hypothetical protein
VLQGRRRRVLDSTLLEDAVATQDTVTQLVAAIRRVRRLVPEARGVGLAAHDYDRPGKPRCAWDDPQAAQALVSGLVGDALVVLGAVAEVDLDAEQAEAVALLALVAGQDVEPGQRPGAWRIARKVAKDRVISTVDPQARHAHKTSAQGRDGYKAHIAAEPETGLVTECALTAANLADGPTGVGLLGAPAHLGRNAPRRAYACRGAVQGRSNTGWTCCRRRSCRVLVHSPVGDHENPSDAKQSHYESCRGRRWSPTQASDSGLLSDRSVGTAIP